MTTIAKKLFFTVLAGLSLSNGIAQGLSLENYDMTLLNPLVAETQQEFNRIDTAMTATKSLYSSSEDYEDVVYDRKRDAVKSISKRLKNEYKTAKINSDATWFVKKQTYKAFKKFVYRSWKNTEVLPSF